jgi:hypothetical protein
MFRQKWADELTMRDRVEGWIVGIGLALGLPALIFVATN